MSSSIFWVYCGILFFGGFGLMQIFARDLMWELTHWNNQLAGQASERTDTWDAGQVVSGVIMIIFAGVIACWAYGITAEDNARNMRATAVVETAEANRLQRVTELDDDFSDTILMLQSQATTQSTRVRAVDVGVNMSRRTEIEYGFCDENETFYAYIIYYLPASYSNDQKGYAYLPERTTPDYCQPPNWNFFEAAEMGRSKLGGYWYEIDFYTGFSIPATSTTVRATRTPNPSSTSTPTRATRTPTPVGRG